MNLLARLVAAAALFALGGCAMFYSEQPVYTRSDGQPAYGPEIRGVELRSKPDDKPLKMSSAWRDGAYLHAVRKNGFKSKAPQDQISEILSPLPGLADHFVSQRQTTADDGQIAYYYELIARGGENRWLVYNMTCGDLSDAERRQFNMTPPSLPPPPEPPAASEPATMDPARECFVTNRADLEAAFTLIAGRKQPLGELRVLPKRRGLFGR